MNFSCKDILTLTLYFSKSFIAFPFLLAEIVPQRENVGQSKKNRVHIFLQCKIKSMSISSTQFLTWSTSTYFFKSEKKPEAGTMCQSSGSVAGAVRKVLAFTSMDCALMIVV